MPEPRTERQPGHKAGELRKEILQRTAELRPFLDTHRERFADSLYTQLSDAQWEQFCDVALQKLIPGLLIGRMRGMRVGIREAYPDELGDYQPCSLDEAIEWFTTSTNPIHDMYHVAFQIYQYGTSAPRFLSGNKRDLDHVPSFTQETVEPHPLLNKFPQALQAPLRKWLLQDERTTQELLPIAARLLMTPGVMVDELYVTLLGGQPMTIPIPVNHDGSITFPMQTLQSFALLSRSSLFEHYVNHHNTHLEEYPDTCVREWHSEIYAIYDQAKREERELTTDENWRIYLLIFNLTIYNQMLTDASQEVSPAVLSALAEYFPDHIQTASESLPEELWRLFDYVDRNGSQILKGGSQLFDLFMATGNMDTEWLAERNLLPDRLQKYA